MINTGKENSKQVITVREPVKQIGTPFRAITPFLLVLILCITPVIAMQPGNITYWSNITPHNSDIYELAVHPGDDLLQGRSYDLTAVYGFSGAFAHWNDRTIQGNDCNPDVVVNTSYIVTNGKIRKQNVYIDPSQWPTGDWFQWEGCFVGPYVAGSETQTYVPYTQDNNYMFTVINYSYDLPIIRNWQNYLASLPVQR